jgi:hypothetical protein
VHLPAKTPDIQNFDAIFHRGTSRTQIPELRRMEALHLL